MKRLCTFLMTVTMAVGLFLSPFISQEVLAVDLSGDHKLTVIPASEEFTDEDADLEGTAVVDIYRVAVAVADDKYDTIHFKAVSAYAGLQDKLTDEQSWTAASWEALAMEAAEIALAGDSPVEGGEGVAMNQKFTLPKEGGEDTGAGLYLLIVRGKDSSASDQGTYIEDSPITYVDTKSYHYTYKPQLVSVPTTNADLKPGADGKSPEVKTSDGEWFSDVKVTIKPARHEYTTTTTTRKVTTTRRRPRTGNENNLGLLLTVVVISGSALVALLIYGARRSGDKDQDEE